MLSVELHWQRLLKAQEFKSSLDEGVRNRHFRWLVENTDESLPFLVSLLDSDTDTDVNVWYVFLALREIFGEGPDIPECVSGQVRPVTECWRAWLHSRMPKGT